MFEIYANIVLAEAEANCLPLSILLLKGRFIKAIQKSKLTGILYVVKTK